MNYRVRVTGPARSDIKRQTRYIAIERQEPVSAERWRDGVIGAITALAEFPRSHARLSLGIGFDDEVRYAVFFSHLIVFGVDEGSQLVTVYRIVHGAAPSLNSTSARSRFESLEELQGPLRPYSAIA